MLNIHGEAQLRSFTFQKNSFLLLLYICCALLIFEYCITLPFLFTSSDRIQGETESHDNFSTDILSFLWSFTYIFTHSFSIDAILHPVRNLVNVRAFYHAQGCEYWENKFPHPESRWWYRDPLYENYCSLYNASRFEDISRITMSASEFRALMKEEEPFKNSIQGIPRIIHQQHMSRRKFPHYFADYVKECHEMNSGWIHVVWTDDDFGPFLKDLFGQEMLDFFRSLPRTIQRIDIIRYFILLEYGGVYLDADVICLSSLDQWVEEFGKSYEVFMEPIHIIASRKGHSFWKCILDRIKDEEVFRTAGGEDIDACVLSSNGSVLADRSEQLFRPKYLDMLGVSTWQWKRHKEEEIQKIDNLLLDLLGCTKCDQY